MGDDDGGHKWSRSNSLVSIAKSRKARVSLPNGEGLEVTAVFYYIRDTWYERWGKLKRNVRVGED